MTMKLMSWNVAKKDEKLPQQQLEAIGKAQADILALQQADILALQEAASSNVEDFKARLVGIGLIHVFTTFDLPDDLGLEIGPSESGLILASRWPLESMPGFFGKIPWQKSALSVVIKSDYGEIEMHNVHVPNASSSGRWRKEAESGSWTYDKPTPETKKCVVRSRSRLSREYTRHFQGCRVAEGWVSSRFRDPPRPTSPQRRRPL